MNKYVRILRIDHWPKNLIMVPGIFFAFVLKKNTSAPLEFNYHLTKNVFITLLSLCLMSSANYAINEYLDREYDRFHPIKQNRVAVINQLNVRLVLLFYIILIMTGLIISASVSKPILILSMVFAICGLLYNVKPFRLKDVQYFDVLLESLNNPIRFALGWYSTEVAHSVPTSAFISFWGAGAFLMSLKRYAEYESSVDKSLLSRYRKSFEKWNAKSLLIFAINSEGVSLVFAGFYLASYKLEYILLIPSLLYLFGTYLHLALQLSQDSTNPEKLWLNRSIQKQVAAIIALTFLLGQVEIYYLHEITGL